MARKRRTKKKKRLVGYNYGGNINTPQAMKTMLITAEEQERAAEAEQNSQRADIITKGVSSLGGAAANALLPGSGPLVSAGLNFVGGLVSSNIRKNAYPKEQYVPAKNTNRYGYNMGGQMPEQVQQEAQQVPGGELQPMGDAMHVQGNDPSQTDGVMLNDEVALDDNEVVREDKVYSDSLADPMNGYKSFAETAKKISRKEGKAKKNLSKIGVDIEKDKEYKDGKYFKKQAEEVFQRQEGIAGMLGLREQGPNGESMPVQGNMKYGGRMKGYCFGGKLKRR